MSPYATDTRDVASSAGQRRRQTPAALFAASAAVYLFLAAPRPALPSCFAAEDGERPSLPAAQTAEWTLAAALPPLGKWLYNSERRPADWLGVPYMGKPLYEPVNVIIADAVSASREEAVRRLSLALRAAGFPSRWGHSTGYLVLLDGEFLPQIRGGKARAFSDAPWYKANNHGRVFGPELYGGKYWFVAAFSRQRLSPFRRVRHRFVSFNEARDSFAWSMNNRTDYKFGGFIELGNAPGDGEQWSAGDHDGRAVLMEACVR